MTDLTLPPGSYFKIRLHPRSDLDKDHKVRIVTWNEKMRLAQKQSITIWTEDKGWHDVETDWNNTPMPEPNE